MNARQNNAGLILALALVVGGCASSAPIHDVQPGDRPALETDEAGLWQMVERDEFKLRTSAEVIRDPALEDYLESVTCRVAPDYCADVRVYVLPSHRLQAFMMPNGTMVLFTGLLLRLENEAQLAAIIGHEIAHYAKRHSLQRYRALRGKTGALQTVASVVSAGAGVAAASANSAAAAGQYGRAIEHAELARSIANVGSAVLASMEYYAVMSQLTFSRDQESESDALGVAWMHTAGYDPATFADVWTLLESEEALVDGRVPTFLRTHPPPADRRQRVNALSAALPGQTLRATSRNATEYRTQVAPFRNAWLHYARQGLSFRLEEALIQRQRELGAPAGLVSFHEAEMYRKRDAEGDRQRALEKYREAVANGDCPPEAFREFGLALWDAGRHGEARGAFERYLDADPDAVDYAMIESYIEELPRP